MNTYAFEIKIPASTPEEARSKAKSVCDLLSKLKEKELAKLAHVVANDPIKTALAKSALGL